MFIRFTVQVFRELLSAFASDSFAFGFEGGDVGLRHSLRPFIVRKPLLGPNVSKHCIT